MLFLGSLIVLSIALSFLDFRCLVGSRETCYKQALAVQRGNRPERAAVLFRAACRRGHAAGCVKAAQAYFSGIGFAQDYVRARKLLEKGCNLGDGEGCYLLAGLYRTGRGTPADAVRAAELLRQAEREYQKSCSTGDANSCSAVGFMFLRGEGAGHTAAEGLQHLRRACELNDVGSCIVAAREYRKGQLVARNAPVAVRLHEKACSNHFSAPDCCAAAAMYLTGDGVPADRDQARELFAQACEGGETHGCMAAWAAGTNVSDSLRDAAQSLVNACTTPTYPPAGCNGQCASNGQPGSNDVQRARQAFERLCDGGEMLACYAVGSMFGHAIGAEGDLAKSAVMMTKACDGNVAMACNELAKTHAFGIGVPKDLRRAAELYRKACSAGSKFACHALSSWP